MGEQWEWKFDSDKIALEDENGNHILVYYHGTGHQEFFEPDYEKRQLIAAAPELLEIAEEYLAMFESFDEHMPDSTKKHRENIRSVVKKAKAEGDMDDLE